RTCFYEVVCFSGMFNTTNIRIEEPEKFEYIWNSQKFGTSYSIAIMGKNKDHTRESKKAWLNFTTPDCFYYFKKCGPPPPQNVSLQRKLVTLSKYDVTVSWAEPVMQPFLYWVTLITELLNGEIKVDAIIADAPKKAIRTVKKKEEMREKNVKPHAPSNPILSSLRRPYSLVGKMDKALSVRPVVLCKVEGHSSKGWFKQCT
ncbi:hypothetical protein Cfor_06185, partial [Coptotermes formosanus]